MPADRPNPQASRLSRFDLNVLPLIVNPPAAADIPREQIRGRFDAYPISCLRLLRGIDFLLGINVDVINLSLGPTQYLEDDPLQSGLEYAINHWHVPVVVAADNKEERRRWHEKL
jgi:hypothetical protein